MKSFNAKLTILVRIEVFPERDGNILTILADLAGFAMCPNRGLP